MHVLRISRYIPWTLSLAVASSCSSSQTGSEAKRVKKKGENKTIEEGVSTSLQISEGALKGTTVDVPAGSLPPGSNVNLRSSRSPSAFAANSDVSAASEAVAITAQDEEGNEIVDLVNPMTIQLPVNSTALAAVEQTNDNMCTFLETLAGDRFVWRRAALSVTDNKVTFESKRLGIFQVVYCGTTKIDGFSEASESEVAGSASESIAEITIPANEFKDFGYTPATYCAGVASNVEDEDQAEGQRGVIWGFTQVEASPWAVQVIDIKRSPGKNLADLGDTDKTLLFLFLQKEGQPCNFENAEADPEGEVVLAWRQAGAVFKSGIVVGTVGDNLSYSSIPLSIATGPTYAEPTAKTVCIATKTGDASSGGLSETVTTFDAAGTIGGIAQYRVLYVPGGGEEAFFVYMGTEKCEGDNRRTGTVVTDPTTQVLRASFHDFSSQTSLKLVPVNVSVTGIRAEVAALGLDFANACVAVLDPADGVTQADNASHYEKALLSLIASAKVTATYESYLPLLPGATATSKYDMLYKGLSDSSAVCSSAGKKTQKTQSILTNPIVITPPGL